jgi:AcrR family transcriptional regulator
LHQDNNQRKRCMPKQPTAAAETEPRRRARSKEAKALKRRTLLQAALDLFMAHGFQGTSIEMITDRAGESTGTFYLYFKNKVDIYRTLTNEGYEILNERLMESVSWPGMNTVAKISSAIQAYYRFIATTPDIIGLSIFCISTSPNLSRIAAMWNASTAWPPVC